MKKILVEKSEGIAEVIDRIVATNDDEILLVIPKGSALAKSASNFRLLKREAGLAEKQVTVSSADPAVIELAAANGIDTPESQAEKNEAVEEKEPVEEVSDIVVRSRDAAARPGKKSAGGGVRLTVHAEPEEDEDEAEDEEDEAEENMENGKETARVEEKQSSMARDRFFSPRSAGSGTAVSRHDRSRERDDEDDDEETRGGSGKAIAWTIGTIVVLGAFFYGGTLIFGRAQVKINFSQTPWNYQANVTADKAVATTTVTSGTTMMLVVPGQVFTNQKNITKLFPATGQSQNIASKAQGTITIYNDYSSSPQDLVATTRFATPDGKIFRLATDVTVPGAQVGAGGALTPSSIDAPIVADQGGTSYNVGPVAKLTIPGFQKTPAKYAGFYGEIKGTTAGGAVGLKPIPTLADVSAAKASTTAILQEDLRDSLAASYPNNFKILDGATSIQVTKISVSTTTDANGNFSVFGEATLQAIGFDEVALKSYLLGLAQNALQGQPGGTTLTFSTFTPNYGNAQASFSKGQVSFALGVDATLEPAFQPDDFASQLAGTSISQARNLVQNLPQLADGKISVSPVWLWKMPSDPTKIDVVAN